MKLEQKHILMIVGGVVLLAVIGIGIYLITRPNPDKDDKDGSSNDDDEDKDKGENDEPEIEDAPAASSALDFNYNYPAGTIGPNFNVEGELTNSAGQLMGQTLYPKRENMGGFGYANIRSSPSVNTETAWYDPFDNLIVTLNSGTPIGKVIGSAAGLYNGHSYTWFKVKLTKPYKNTWTYTEGYVRGDTVTFIPFKT